MEDPIRAVLIQDEFDSLGSLPRVLANLSVETHCANGFKEAKRLIVKHQPHLVFANQSQWCDYFEEIVCLASSADHVFDIIVVGPMPQVEWRASAIDHGAFEYVAPPFTHESLTGVVHSAVLDVIDRRQALVRALHP
jgi:DNA-binding NtrC family response regulator